jgi:hypothetical protein
MAILTRLVLAQPMIGRGHCRPINSVGGVYLTTHEVGPATQRHRTNTLGDLVPNSAALEPAFYLPTTSAAGSMIRDQVVRIDGYHDSMSSIQSFLRPCDQTFRIKKGVSHKQVVGRADATHLILFS